MLCHVLNCFGTITPRRELTCARLVLCTLLGTFFSLSELSSCWASLSTLCCSRSMNFGALGCDRWRSMSGILRMTHKHVSSTWLLLNIPWVISFSVTENKIKICLRICVATWNVCRTKHVEHVLLLTWHVEHVLLLLTRHVEHVLLLTRHVLLLLTRHIEHMLLLTRHVEHVLLLTRHVEHVLLLLTRHKEYVVIYQTCGTCIVLSYQICRTSVGVVTYQT